MGDPTFDYEEEDTELGTVLHAIDHDIDEDTPEEEIVRINVDLEHEAERLVVFSGISNAAGIDHEVAMFSMITGMSKLVEAGVIDRQVRETYDKLSGGIYKVLMHNLEAEEAE